MKKIELLAPAGNKDALMAAVYNGANAVYLGGTSFGARAFSNNFNHDEMIEAITFCHIHGVKVYVTMNTMLFEKEIEQAIKEVDFLYNHDVDALLIQDLGLLYLVREQYPDLEVHASTQMHIHNVQGVKFAKEIGVSRAVLARETSIDTIKECCKQGIEIETFAYGALCICYSGECLMSSITKQRSGNRGMCAQCCRLPYDLVDEDKAQDVITNGNYLLSPKDLNLINHIPDLIKSGVTSLKIEGRMKRSEYVALVTKTFREAIDAYYNNEVYTLTPQRLKELKLLFCREFTEGYVFNKNGSDLMNPFRPNHLGVPLGKVIKASANDVTIKLIDTLNQEDGIRFISEDNEDLGLMANRIEKDGLLVNSAMAGDVVTLPFSDYVEIGAQVVKTTDAILLKEINNFSKSINNAYRVDLEASFEANVGQPFKLTVSDGTNTVEAFSKIAVEQAQKAPMDIEKISTQISKCGDTPYNITKIDGHADNIFIPVSALNEVRRLALDLLTEKRKVTHVRLGKKKFVPCKVVPYALIDNLIEVNDAQQVEALTGINAYLFSTNKELNYKFDNVYTLMPTVNETSKVSLSSPIMISEIGNLNQQLDNCYASSSFNIANSYAVEFLIKHHVKGMVVSYELDETKLEWLIEGFKKRHSTEPPIYVLTYGKRDLMITKANLLYEGLSNTALTSNHYGLRNYDGKIFDLYVDSDKITHILESAAYHEGRYTHHFIRFTNETKEKVEEIVGEL